MNENKICFIICTNNEQFFSECCTYLSLLEVPEGVETEMLAIRDAKSMCAGYNEAMHASDAKYKVYLHQDTFIIEPKFIEKLLKVFCKDEKIGVVGMIGAPHLSQDGVMWNDQRCGDAYRLEEIIREGENSVIQLKHGKEEVDVVDGLLIATQYDIPWREDILEGWDFYDVSQCLEFKRAGYKVVVPAQNPSWTIHKCGVPAYWNYEKNRRIIMENYPEIVKNPEKKRILFVHSKQITLMGLVMGIQELGHSVTIWNKTVNLIASVPAEQEALEETLEHGHFDLVMTYDFCPSISDACENMKVKYYAWVYDSPLMETYMKQSRNSYTHISVFDKKQFNRLQTLKVPHLYLQHLACEVDVFGGVSIKKKDEKHFGADVSFVGRLYNKRGYEELFGEGDEKYKEEADAIVSGTNCIWDGETNVFGKASDELIQHITDEKDEKVWELYDIDKRYYAESMKLVRKCNEIERVKILETLAQQFKVTLYTDKPDDIKLKNVKTMPWVDYWKEMPKVFYLSKINLNITSRSIETGIPQRVIDIMAVGGFVLTNYQPELEDYFEIGKDLEVYHNLEELIEKTRYYLEHEDQRVRIAINGYQKVRRDFTYASALKQILPKILEDEV